MTLSDFAIQLWLYGIAVIAWLCIDAPFGEQDERGFRTTPRSVWRAKAADFAEAERTGQ